MVTVEEAARFALALPEVTEGLRYGNRAWQVKTKTFLWERPFSKADLKRFGDEPVPDGVILAASVADLGEKEAALAANPQAFFTIEHFEGFAAVLIQLSKVSRKTLHEAITDAWLTAAPPKLAKEFIARKGQ